MKPISFTIEERDLLLKLLSNREENYLETLKNFSGEKKDKKKWESFYLKPLQSALKKISISNTSFYTDSEKRKFISCIQEHKDDFNNKLDWKSPLSWLSPTIEQVKLAEKIDTCKDILLKCGSQKKADEYSGYYTPFRYYNFFKTIQKLKESETIFLSKSGENNYYKIAFVYKENEYMPFELKNSLSMINLNFISFNGKSTAEIGVRNYGAITNKSEAKKLLSSYSRESYQKEVFDFMQVLLS